MIRETKDSGMPNIYQRKKGVNEAKGWRGRREKGGRQGGLLGKAMCPKVYQYRRYNPDGREEFKNHQYSPSVIGVHFPSLERTAKDRVHLGIWISYYECQRISEWSYAGESHDQIGILE